MSTSEPIKILIVDDHDMVRKGLIVLLENFDDLEVIGEVGDGQLAVDLCRRQPVDVVLMDILMPHMGGVEATQQLQEVSPHTQILILTSYSEEENVEEALKAGAIGYLMKNISGDALVDAIRKAYNKQSTLAPEAAQVLIRATTRPPTLGHDLTKREMEVLQLMISGMSNQEIASELVISSSTVKNHVSSILLKMGTTTRTQAVALAVEHKIT